VSEALDPARRDGGVAVPSHQLEIEYEVMGKERRDEREGQAAFLTRSRSETVQIRALAREIGVRPRSRTWQYGEEPGADFSRQSAEMRRRSSDLVRKAAWTGRIPMVGLHARSV
ncbi:MAG: hypothetical protein JRS35_28200, partial [Deltaproteobacteria bacterium]|nr:hypothetical protein [Deltaproteobacteria bacterium]